MDVTTADPSGAVEKPGRRERKKQETRRRLELAALDLFEQRGYDATTVEDVTEAADVAVRTFFRYFPTKEAVLVGPTEDALAALSLVLADRPAEEAPYTAVVTSLRALRTDALVAQETEVLRRLRLAGQVPSARAGVLQAYQQWEDALAEHVRSGSPDADPLDARLVAAGAMAAFRVAVESWVAGDGGRPLAELFDVAADRIGEGLRGVGTPPASN